jgi:hypothetical protein
MVAIEVYACVTCLYSKAALDEADVEAAAAAAAAPAAESGSEPEPERYLL